MRRAFAAELVRLAHADSRIVLLMGDIGNTLFDEFRSRWPDRFFNAGIGEQNMISMAAGMAMAGLRPVCYTIIPFATARCLEQIRVDVCYHSLQVTIVGVGAGLSYAKLGYTHHGIEDVAWMRSLPGMQVLSPCDPVESKSALSAALSQDGPCYVRIGKDMDEVAGGDLNRVEFGTWNVVDPGEGVTILCVGDAVLIGQAVAVQLQESGIVPEIVSCCSVKPIDDAYLWSCQCDENVIVTIEEHSLIGGLGSAVSEYFSDNCHSWPYTLLRFGLRDQFYHFSGDRDFLRSVHGLTVPDIASQIKEVYRGLH